MIQCQENMTIKHKRTGMWIVGGAWRLNK